MYRLFIDEVGNADLIHSDNPNNRYLCLTGIIIDLDHEKRVIYPRLEEIKRKCFGHDPEMNSVILHRKEIIHKSGKFVGMESKETERLFNYELLSLLVDVDYQVICVVIDKQEFVNRYQVWVKHPYHYCLEVLVEKYVLWLKSKKETGDVLIEARGGKEDTRLKQAYSRLYACGTSFVDSNTFQKCLSSKEIKIKLRQQIFRDCKLPICLRMFKFCYNRKNGFEQNENFGAQIVKVLLDNNKICRSPNGKIDGYGIKFLP